MKTKTFAEKQQEWKYLLEQARQKLETMTRAQLKRFVGSHGPGKLATAVAREQQ